jgi:hypothetical protein
MYPVMSFNVLRSFPAIALSVCAALLSGGAICSAGDAYTLENYATVDYSGRAAGLASSTVWSILGPIDEQGLRLKLDGFAGVYGESNASVISSAFMAANMKTLTDLMAGYQLHWDSLWIKLYAGAALQRQTRLFSRYGVVVSTQEYGATAAVETFWRGPGRLWGSMNLSWLQFDDTFSLYERAAYEVVRAGEGLNVSIGAETGTISKSANAYRLGRRLDVQERFVKGGALIDLRYFSHDLTLSGGMEEASSEGVWRPYATLSYGQKF